MADSWICNASTAIRGETLKALGKNEESPEPEIVKSNPLACLTLGKISPERGINLPKTRNTPVGSLLHVVISRAAEKLPFILTINNTIFIHRMFVIFRQLTGFYTSIRVHESWTSAEWLIIKVNIWLKAEAETVSLS